MLKVNAKVLSCFPEKRNGLRQEGYEKLFKDDVKRWETKRRENRREADFDQRRINLGKREQIIWKSDHL